MKFLIKLLVGAVSVFAAAYIIPGVTVDSFVTAGIVAIVLGVLNTFVRPILVFLTFPINILTLGLFYFVINAALILIVAHFVIGFAVSSVLVAILFGVVLSLINSFLSSLVD